MLQQMSMSHLPSLCWAWSALLERHLQNHNLQKRGIKLRIRNTSSGEGGKGDRGECEGGFGEGDGKGEKQNNLPPVSETHEKTVREHGCKWKPAARTVVPAGCLRYGSYSGTSQG